MDPRTAAAEHPQMGRTTGREFWLETIHADPDIFHRLMGDLWKATQAANGRPGAAPSSLDEVFGLLVPEYSTEPFHIALQAKMAGRGVRWLGQQIGVSKSLAHFYLSGQRAVVKAHDPAASLERIERIARAVHVHPSYFAEWRRIWVLLLLDDAFAQHPNLSIGVWKKFASASTPAMNGR